MPIIKGDHLLRRFKNEEDRINDSAPQTPKEIAQSPEKKKNSINVGILFKERLGFEFTGQLNEQGDPIFIDTNVAESDPDMNRLVPTKQSVIRALLNEGINPEEVNIEFNSPDEALNISPLSFTDRAKLSVGNEKGKINFLKSKFDAVISHKDHGLIVKNKGVWQKVDPSFFGSSNDPYEMTQELMKDIADLFDIGIDLVGQATGAAAGTAAGLPLIGVGIGQAAATKTRMSLGRAFGTYETNDEQDVKDIALESLFAMAGQKFAAGFRGNSKIMGKAEEVAKSMTNNTKEILSFVWGGITGAGRRATRTLVDQGKAVGKEIDRFFALAKKKGFSTAEDVQGLIREEQVKISQSILEQARPALSKKYGDTMKSLIDAVPDNLVVDIGQIIKSSQQKMLDSGLGTFHKVKGKDVFKLFNDEQLTQALANGAAPEFVDKTAMSALRRYNIELNKFAQIPLKRGKEAARQALQVKRALSDSFYAVTKSEAPGTRRALAVFSNEVDKTLGDVFEKSGIEGLSNLYAKKQAVYSMYAEAVNIASRLASGEKGAETLVNQLAKGSGSNATRFGMARDLGNLIGDKAKEDINRIFVLESAKKFSSWAPQFSRDFQAISGAGGLGVIGGAVTGTIPVSAAVAATQFSPKIVRTQIRMAQEVLNFARIGGSKFTNNRSLFDPIMREMAVTFGDRIIQTEDKEKQLGSGETSTVQSLEEAAREVSISESEVRRLTQELLPGKGNK